MAEQETWYISEWLAWDNLSDERREAILELIENSPEYPRPRDCPGSNCSEYRPTCILGVCKVAMIICEEWG